MQRCGVLLVRSVSIQPSGADSTMLGRVLKEVKLPFPDDFLTRDGDLGAASGRLIAPRCDY